MAKSQSNLNIISLEASDGEDESECESSSSKSHDRESTDAGPLAQKEEIFNGLSEWEPQSKSATKACRTPEGKGEGKREQSHPTTLPSKNLVTPAVSWPWRKSSEQPKAIVKPFHREKIEEFDTWQDEHSRRKHDQSLKFHKGNYYFRRDKGQISKPTNCTFEVHFDKGQTRCFWNNPSLIIKVTHLQLEYL